MAGILPETFVSYILVHRHNMNKDTVPLLLSKTTLSICSALVLAIFVAQALYDIFFHPLRKIPGPFLARFSQTWRNIRYFRGSWHSDVVQLHRTYGNVVRIAPNEVSFVDPAALKDLYGLGKQVYKVCGYVSD